MPQRPLILSPASDINALAAAWGLRQLAIEPIISPTLCTAEIGTISLQMGDNSPWSVSGGLAPERIGVVWNRRPRDPEVFPGVHEMDSAFVGDEWILFQRNVYALSAHLSDSLWINPPAAAIKGENKLVQLAVARRCGIDLPPTLVSNDPDQIRAFVRRHGQVVYKSFMPHAWHVEETGQRLAFYVRVLDPASHLDDAALRMCPGIYQAYVDKTHDLRVTVIGDRYFTVALLSTTSAVEVDWRVHSFTPGLRVEPCSLPGALESKLRSLMSELGIVFGCIDLAVDRDGAARFLEVNQGGQFLFLEEQDSSGGLPLLRAMCAILAQGRTDYSLDAMPPIRYADYLETEGHKEWYESAMRHRREAIAGSRPETRATSRGVTVE